MIAGPCAELRRFAVAALVDPVARDHGEGDRALRRRRVVAAATFLVGSTVLAVALRIPGGDPAFYAATAGLAAVWTGGAFASGPLHLGRAHTRAGTDPARPVVQSLALGALLVGVFLVGALVLGRIPPLRDPVERLLDHARLGSLLLVALLTAVNGVAEELYFRGALYAAIGRRHAVAVSTALYVLTSLGSGIPLLVLAAPALGLVTGLQRRVTGGVLGPIITHITWSLGMLLLLPTALRIGS